MLVPALLEPAAVSAAPPEEAVRFQYQAPAECPDGAAFVARVRARTARGRLAAEGELARTFVLRLRAAEPSFVGEIEFLGEAAGLVSRQVHGEHCSAVVDSLALITALALDATLAEQEPEATTVTAPSAPRRASSLRSLPSHTAAPTLPPPTIAHPSKLRGVRVGTSGAYASTIEAWTYGVLGQIDWRDGFGLRFAAHYATDERTIDSGRRAALRLLGLRTSVCPFALRSQVLALSPCAGFDFGSLRARGVESEALPEAGGDTIAWAAVGPELRVSWEPAAQYWLELNGDVQFPLVAHKFQFELPVRQVYVVPRVTASVGVATGVRFW